MELDFNGIGHDMSANVFFSNPPAIPNNLTPVLLVSHPGAVRLLVGYSKSFQEPFDS